MTVCRAATSGCDLEEVCDGEQATCGVDHVVPAGEASANACGVGETCDGRGTCASALRWSQRFGALGGDQTNAVTTGPDGSILLAAHGMADFGGGLGSGILTAKFTSDGSFVWSRSATASGVASAITSSPTGEEPV